MFLGEVRADACVYSAVTPSLEDSTVTQPPLPLAAEALGLLREYLVNTHGSDAARTMLTQFGYAHGWRMAEAMQAEFGRRRALSKEGVVINASSEAEQHLLYFGRAETSVCWALCGLTSGYLSRSEGEAIYVLEDRCLGKGDSACHLVGRTREEWGPARADELAFYDPTRLRAIFDEATDPLSALLLKAEQAAWVHHNRRPHPVSDTDDAEARSPAMRHLLQLVHRAGRVESTVFISGESGSGKARAARLVHDVSDRARGPFVKVLCGGSPDEELEDQLFGHGPGPSPRGCHDRPGGFEAANDGTLLLDDIGEVSPALQLKVLRAIENQEIRRVGESRTRRIDVRVLSSSHDDLARAVEEGDFRRDLFHRLKVVELHVPPLRERRDDILALAGSFLAAAAGREKRELLALAPESADHLLRYAWPGNVRELEAAMEGASALARGSRVEPEDLPEEVRRPTARGQRVPGAVRPLEEMEREYILAALKRNGGNQTRTAEQLQIGSATLYRKLKSYGVIVARRRTPKGPRTE